VIEESGADVFSTYAHGEVECPDRVHARQASRATVERKVSFIDDGGVADQSVRRKSGRPRLAAQNGAREFSHHIVDPVARALVDDEPAILLDFSLDRASQMMLAGMKEDPFAAVQADWDKDRDFSSDSAGKRLVF